MFMRRRRGEDGAIAILVALLAVLLLSLAAMGVDIGNQVTRKADTQNQADFAALAAGQQMTGPGVVGTTPAPAIVAAARAELNANQPEDDSAACWRNHNCVTTAALTDGSLNNGEVRYTTLGLQVVAPRHWVSFGMARIMGFDGSYVAASATVNAGTPGAPSELPFYAVQSGGCDWGQQALTDPAKGQVVDSSGVPVNLAQPTASPFPVAWSWQNNLNISGPLTPSSVPVDPTGLTSVSVTLKGVGLAQVNRVGFYRETTEIVNRKEVAITNGDSSGKSITVTIPSEVISNAGLWYIRVFNQPSQQSKVGWSTQTLVLRVGEPLIVCPNLSSSGNFGALKLPRTDSNDSTSNGWMPNNIADRLQSPLSLAANPSAPSATCVDGQPNVVFSTVTGSPVLKPKTNCVATDTGLTATATTSGLITGTPLFPGRLTKKSTSTGILGSRNCAPGHSSSNRSVLGKSINNDTLTCFMIDPNMKISTIASATYNNGQALDPSIYKSPRFCLVPVLKQKPTQGGSANYWIVDVRACFITSESNSSSWNTQVFDTSQGQATTDNGITLNSSGNKVQTLDVVFFNHDALPNHGANIGDYIGVGPKAMQLVQ